MKALVAFAFCLFALSTSVAQSPLPTCISSQIDGETVLISLPSDIASGLTEVHWKLGDMDMEDDRSRSIKFQVDPFATGTYRVAASDANSHELCAAIIDPKTYIANTVPYTDIRLGPMLAEYTGSASYDKYTLSTKKAGSGKDLEKIGTKKQTAAANRTKDKIMAADMDVLQGDRPNRMVILDTSQLSTNAPAASSPAKPDTTTTWTATPAPETRFAATANVVTVHFVTERAISADQSEVFAVQRDPAKAFHYGIAFVTVPQSHKRMFVTDALYWSYKQSDFSSKLTPPLSEDDFYKSFSNEINKLDPTRKQILVFIHGFNNGFLEDIYKTAQLAYDTHFSGAPIMFDWPTKNGLLDYTHDRTEVDNSKEHLAEFLRDLASKSGGGTVNIVAHSMGNRLLLEALDLLRRENKLPQLGQIIMAAPDVDSTRFMAVMSGLVSTNSIKRVTVYGSHKDWAMWCSKHENSGLISVGALPPEIQLNGIDQIDASTLPMNFVGHDYFITSRPVLNDIGLLLQSGNAPPRVGILPVPGSSYSFWRFAGQH